MSKGKTKSSSTTRYNNTQTLNPWSQNQWQGQFDKIQGMLSDSPVQAYSGDLVAGLSGREQQARGMYEQNMGSFNPQFDESADMIRNAGLFADFGSQAEQYMNPFQTQVIDTLRTQSGDNLAEALAQSRERSLRNRAYGGSGSAVSEGIATAEAQKALDAQLANLLYSGFNDARSMYGADIDARERRAVSLADLAAGRHQMNTADIMGLNTLGEVDRGIEQDRMGANYNEWLRQQDEELRRIGIQTGLLGAIPMLTNSSGTQSSNSTQTTNPGLLGTLGQVGGIASMFVPGGGMAGLFSGAMKTAGGAAGVAGGATNSVSEALKRLQMGS